MNRQPPAPKRSPSGDTAWHRLGRGLRRFHGLAYALVAAGAMAAAGMQPPHAAAVEVGTLMVATTVGDDLAWPATAPDTTAR